jgi:hypothetical protein
MQRCCVWLKGVAEACAVTLGLICGFQASGGGLVYNFDTTFSGTDPNGSGPWVTASLMDDGPGAVVLSIANINISDTEKVGELYLNINPSYNPTQLQFAFLGGSAGVTGSLPTLGEDSFKADGDGKYDILFQFSQPPSTAFGAGDYLQYRITGIPTLTSADFLYLSSPAGGHGPFYSAIHVQGISATGVNDTTTYSGWVAPNALTGVVLIPEPTSLALLLCAAGVGAGARRLRRNTAS